MAIAWVGAFDQSKTRVPISRMQEAHDAGYLVAGFYCGGGSADKWPSQAEVKAWLSRPGAGVAMLFEIFGTEPIDFPSAGGAHARRARAAARTYGYPDHAAIFVAVDRDVTLAQAHAQLTVYFRNWAAADTCKPVPYVEADAGAVLFAEGLTAGTFTPAAWGWNNPAVLYTPANAPSHVLWTQEHNGVNRFGGNLDLGHIRTDAPIMWATTSTHADVGVDMPLTQADADLVAATLKRMRIDDAGPPPSDPKAEVSLGVAIRASYFRDGYLANTGVPQVLADEATAAAAIEAIHAQLASLPAVIVAALPEGGPNGLTKADVQAAAAQAVTDVMTRTTAALSVAPPPAAPGA